MVYICLNDLELSNHHPYVIMLLGETTLGHQSVRVLCWQTHRAAPAPAQSPSIQVQCGCRQSTTQWSLWLGMASCGCPEGYHCEIVRGEADTCCLQIPCTWRRIENKSLFRWGLQGAVRTRPMVNDRIKIFRTRCTLGNGKKIHQSRRCCGSRGSCDDVNGLWAGFHPFVHSGQSWTFAPHWTKSERGEKTLLLMT